MSSRSIGLSDALHQYVMQTGTREDKILQELRLETEEHPYARMQISPEQGQFMRLLTKMLGTKRYLEVGTFTGYSSLCVALETPADAEIICCDINKDFTDIARKYWDKAGVADKVSLHLQPALKTLDELIAKKGPLFDLAFIDADKTSHVEYYERCLKLVRPGGIVAVDNSLWSGSVVDPQDDDSRAIDALNRHIHADERVFPSLVPIGDGLMLAMKR